MVGGTGAADAAGQPASCMPDGIRPAESDDLELVIKVFPQICRKIS